jgi:diacylglycerol O-acyltransferase / wax synthase
METYAERLSAQDSSFLAFESRATPMHVAGLSIYESRPLRGARGTIDVDRIRAHIGSRLHLIPRYRQRLAYVPLEGSPTWIDDDRFDLDRHVRAIALPRPGSDPQLKELAADLIAQPLNLARPVWEVWIIEGLRDGRFAMLTKLHHCMIDGASGVDLMSLLLSPNPDDTAIEAAPAWTPRPAPSGLDLFSREAARRIEKPLALARSLAGGLRKPTALAAEVASTASAAATTLTSALAGSAETPLNRPVGPNRRLEWVSFDLADVKAVKNALGGTVNDVILATATGAMRSFLEMRGVDVESIDFRAVVPVNVRSDAERGTLGNRVAAWIVSLPLAEHDATARLAELQRRTSDLKASKQSLAAEILNAVGEWLGFGALQLMCRLSNRIRPYNLIVTNVRGPDFPFYMLGAKMLACYPALPLFESQGLGIALFSYLGKIHWGLTADRDLVPDLADFARALRRSFTELRAAGRVRAPRHRSRSRPGAMFAEAVTVADVGHA